jgi:hypothetical protein
MPQAVVEKIERLPEPPNRAVAVTDLLLFGLDPFLEFLNLSIELGLASAHEFPKACFVFATQSADVDISDKGTHCSPLPL